MEKIGAEYLQYPRDRRNQTDSKEDRRFPNSILTDLLVVWALDNSKGHFRQTVHAQNKLKTEFPLYVLTFFTTVKRLFCFYTLDASGLLVIGRLRKGFLKRNLKIMNGQIILASNKSFKSLLRRIYDSKNVYELSVVNNFYAKNIMGQHTSFIGTTLTIVRHVRFCVVCFFYLKNETNFSKQARTL